MNRRELLSLSLPALALPALAQAVPATRYGQLRGGREEPILEPDIPIIDSHQHLLDRPGLRYLIDDYLADVQAGHRIVASVYVETMAFARKSGPEVLRPLGEVEFANGVGAMCESGAYGACRACAAIVGHADLRLGDRVAELLDRALELAPNRFKGVRQVTLEHPSPAPFRFISSPPPKGVMSSPGFRPAFRHLVQRGLSFDASMFHHQLPDLMALADEFPYASIVLNHCGTPMMMELDEQARNGVFLEWRKMLFDLARRPNVICKVGGLGMPFWGFRLEERTDSIGYMELAALWRPYVETTIEAFGADRCMMESNYPPDARSAGFVPLWNALKHIVTHASPDEKAALFHKTAARVYRIPVSTQS